ncbi:MAG: TonB-dependent receptor [Mangrovibacterium sp.]
MKSKIFTLVLLLLTKLTLAQSEITIKGKITDNVSNEPLIGVVIYSKAHSQKAAQTDENGNFTLILPSGKHNIISSYIGYLPIEKEYQFSKSQTLNIALQVNAQMLQDVEVLANGPTEKLQNPQIGVEQIKMKEIAQMPTLFGERDIIRSIQLLPGIKAESDASTGFQVRGGTSSQNLILLDDATVYNAGHLMGIFSTFNDDAIQGASLYKGLIPAQFGGGTSAVLDVTSAAGSMTDYHLKGSVGILAAKIAVEGPIAKDKASFSIAFRRTYFDLYLKLIEQFKNNKLNFFDLNARVDYKINENNHLAVSFFNGKDNMGLDEIMSMQWGNQTLSLRWFHSFNDKLNFNTTFFQSGYLSDVSVDAMDKSYLIKGHSRQLGLKQNFEHNLNNNIDLNYGFQIAHIDLMSGEWNLNYTTEQERRKALENALWLNSQLKITPQTSILAGIRLNAFSALGGAPYYQLNSKGEIDQTLNFNKNEIVKTYFTLEPRLSINHQINSTQSIKAGYARTSQNIQAIRSSFTSFPIDRYTMSSNIIEPQVADQASLGFVKLTNNTKYEFSLETYYKKIQNVLDYKEGKSFSSDIEIEKLILPGNGRSYGFELSAKKNQGKLTGWIAYTLAWSENKINGINNNNWYTAGNDRRHDISIVGIYTLSPKWRLTATWVYNTGQALTAPSAKYELDGETYYYYAERNGYRAPAYHRLDCSATYASKKHEWSFGFYNLYNHYNPFIITFENDETKPSGTKTMQQSLYGIIPSISYNFKF